VATVTDQFEGSASRYDRRRESEVRFGSRAGRSTRRRKSNRLAGRLSRKVDGKRKLEGDWRAWLEVRQAATVAGRNESGTGRLAGDASQRPAGRLGRTVG
jgi:hypothetical protein